jgi:hypothetical protein
MVSNPSNTELSESSAMELSTLQIPHSNIIFDYPSQFTYEIFETIGGLFGAGVRVSFEDSRWTDRQDTPTINSRFYGGDSNFDITRLRSLEQTIADTQAVIDEDFEGGFELLEKIETDNGRGYFFRTNTQIGMDYLRHGYFDESGFLTHFTLVMFIPLNYVADYEGLFETIIGSIRYVDSSDSSIDTSLAEQDVSAQGCEGIRAETPVRGYRGYREQPSTKFISECFISWWYVGGDEAPGAPIDTEIALVLQDGVRLAHGVDVHPEICGHPPYRRKCLARAQIETCDPDDDLIPDLSINRGI